MALTIDNKSKMPSEQATKPSRLGSGFTNLQRLMQANRDNRLGQTIGQNITRIAGDVGTGIQKQGEEFKTKTSQSFQPYVGGESFVQSAIADPTKATESQQDYERFRKLRIGEYGGPKSLTDPNILRSGAQQVSQLSKMGGTEAGREVLLSSFVGGPQYTAGQRRLDTLLLQSSPEQTAKLNALKSIAARTGRSLSDLQGLVSSEAETKSREATLLGQKTREQLTGEQEKRDVESREKLARIQREEDERRAKFQDIQNLLSQGQVKEEDLESLGLKDFIGDRSEVQLYGMDPTKYLQTKLSDSPTQVGEVLSGEEAARINALAKLGDQSARFDLSKVGSFKPSTQVLDQNQLTAGIEKGRREVQELENQYEQVAKMGAEVTTARNKIQAIQKKMNAGVSVSPSEMEDANRAIRNLTGAIQSGAYGQGAINELGRFNLTPELLEGGALNSSLGNKDNIEYLARHFASGATVDPELSRIRSEINRRLGGTLKILRKPK